METKQCPHCSKEILKKDYFCPFCGKIAAEGFKAAGEEMESSSDLGNHDAGGISSGSETAGLSSDSEAAGILSEDIKEESSSEDSMSDGRENPESMDEDKINLSDYSDYIRILFNSRMDKWELNLLKDGKHVLRKHFFERIDAEREAVHYLGEIGVLNSSRTSSSSRRSRSRAIYDGVFYSDARSMWGVRIKGYRGSRILGYYDSQSEAVEAREHYLKEKSQKKTDIRRQKNIKTEALVSFSERAGQWAVRIPRRRGGYRLLDYYDSEEEAIEAKDAYFKELESEDSES